MTSTKLKRIPRRPLLQYQGGKWMLAPWVIQHMPNHRVYVEPYGGVANILLRKDPSPIEVYNDLDLELVNLFRIVRDRGDELIAKCEMTPYSRTEYDLAFEKSDDLLEQARRTVVRSVMGWGVYGHYKKSGFRHVGVVRRRQLKAWNAWPADVIPPIIKRLKNVCIENVDALGLMKQYDTAKTLHYVDPPYVVDTRSPSTMYRHDMADEQHEQMAETLNSLKGMVMLAGYGCPLYQKLFKGWRKVELKCNYVMRRGERTEVMWLKNIRDNMLLL